MSAINGSPLCVLSFLWLVSGARISSKLQAYQQNETSEAARLEVGPVGEPWEEDTLYVCMQKWQTAGAFSSSGKFVDQFCLANSEKALEMATSHLNFAADMTRCEAYRESHAFKLCALKGDKPEGRISYTAKTHVPKSCFRETNLESGYAIIAAGVNEDECKKMMKMSIDKQSVLGNAPTTTTTTTTVAEDEVELDTEDEVEIECNCDTGFFGEIENKACSCKPAPCKIIGTVGDGPDCKCLPGLWGEIAWDGDKADGECIAEIKHLFTEGEEFLWKYDDKSVKCCISSKAGKPTHIQDMNADKLPTTGSFGRWTTTGCGYMFGDTYHNGLKAHKGAFLTCPTPVPKIMEMIGKHEFDDEIKALIKLEE